MDWLREEITQLELASSIPLLTALLLGLLGALSPCQLTTNATQSKSCARQPRNSIYLAY